MTADNELDLNTLSWVKSELDETLNQARSSLEVYVEDEADKTQLQFVKNYLHQVYGTLQMVELYGAALAAEEMEKLTNALLEGKIGNRNDAYEVLMRGILQLPDYLEHLLAGHHDMPMVLLPLLNDMRAARGEALLSENALFNPDLGVKAPVNEAITGENLSELTRKLRHNYHLGLLGWFRDRDSEASLARIAEVINTLRESATEEEINRLLWVAGGLVESLRQGGLDSNVSIKLLLGQLDRQFKKVIDNGVTALSHEPPSELLKNLLYYVANSQSDGELTHQIKQAFKLQEVLPDTKTLERARADLTGPNAQLMHTVSSVLLEDLTRLKDNLDLFVRAEQRHIDELRPLCDTFKQMADTLGMLGLGVQRNIINEQLNILNSMVNGEREVDDNILMDMAGAMLSIENSLGELATARAANDHFEEGADEAERAGCLQDAERQKLLQMVIEQTKIELARIKDALSDFSNNPNNRSVLDVVPRMLEQIKGSILILDLEHAAELLNRITGYIKSDLLEGRITPDEDSLDHLADAISSIEYYLESLAGKWGNPNAILTVAEQSLAKLNETTGAAEPSTVGNTTQPDLAISGASDAGPVDEDTLIDLPGAVDELTLALVENTRNDLQTPEQQPVEDFELSGFDLNPDQQAEAVSDEDTLQDIALNGLSLLETGESEDNNDTLVLQTADDLSVNVEPSAVADPPQSDLAISGASNAGPVDEDTLIDLPGAVDELTLALDEDTWNDLQTPEQQPVEDFELSGFDLNPDQQAEAVSDEDTLQDIALDGLSLLETKESEDNDNTLVLQTVDDLSVNFDNLDETGLSLVDEKDAASGSELSLEDDAESFDPDSGLFLEESDTGEIESAEVETPQVEAVSSAGASVALMEEVDDEILEIFMEEADEEYANISRLFPQWMNNPQDEEALKNLRRSFHTLKGSGRLVGAADVGEFAWIFENMLNRVIDKTIQISPEMFQVLEQAKQVLPSLFELFRSGGKPGQQILTLMDHARALSQGNPVVLDEPVLQELEDNISTQQSELSIGSFEKPSLSQLGDEVTETEFADSIEQQTTDKMEDISAEGALDIDPVLLDIYRKEVETHLETVRDYINKWHDNLDRSASNDVLRALHTLTGSSRTTGVTHVSELCSLFEKYFRELQEYSRSVDESTVNLLDQLHAYISRVMNVVEQPGAVQPDNRTLLASIQNLLDSFESTDSVSSLTEPVQPEVSYPESEPEPEAEPESATGTMTADYDEELLDIFIEEGEEILEDSDNTLLHWRDEPENQELIEAMQRQLHTLKGGARMAGVTEIGDLGHSIESMLTSVVDGHLVVSQSMFNLIQRAQDRLAAMLEQVKENQRPAEANELIREVDMLLGRPSLGRQVELGSAVTRETSVGEQTSEDHASSEDEILITSEETAKHGTEDNVITLGDLPEIEVVETPAEAELQLPIERPSQKPVEDDDSRDRRKTPRIQYEQVRVRADLLDNLVNFAGEVSIYRSRMDQQTNAFRFNLQELDDTVSRLREQLRQFEIEAETQIQFKQEERLGQEYDDFDPLEFDRFTQMQHLSRAMMESLNDLDSIKGILSNVTRESETLLLQQSRVNTELQEGLMRTRMVPFSGQAPRLRRIVRQTADEMGKQVELHLQGVDGELDRQVLDRIVPPLEHMLRNAIAHGIETPRQRRSLGKPEIGTINLSLSREGADIIIRVDDDGGGINLHAIHKKAIERGLLKSDDKVTKEILLNMIMQSGFSTAEQITQIAGRGVGMDVVNSEIKQLGGLLEIDTQEGQGTAFTISLPLTLAISRALMIYVGDDLYAVPLLNVQGVERISGAELKEFMQADEPVYHWVDEDYKLLHLGNLLGVTAPSLPDDNERIPLLLVRSGEYRAAIQVEGLMGSREIVVKPVGPQLSTLRGISGATIMGDGGVVLILDLAVLVRLAAVQGEEDVIELTPEPVREVHTKSVVMVVDDSITVRKVTSRLLERNGYEVIQAKDGVDALAQLQEYIPDVMLLDVEMPRMDGFELATNIRNDDRTRTVPIIMITSRTGQKHRDRAMELGVNVYLGKPYNDSTLLENIGSLIDN